MIPLIHIIFSFGLAAFALWKNRKTIILKRSYLFSIGSLGCCALGIIEELRTIKRRLLAGDIGGIEDTIDAVLIICIAFLIVALILNALLLSLAYEPEEKK